MNPLYNAGIHLFTTAVSLGSLRSGKLRKMRQGWRDACARIMDARSRVAPDGYDLWLHAASLGEFEQGRPLIERLRRERPGVRILLTFFSPSGYTVRHDYPMVDTVAYLPPDTPRHAAAFLDAARPRMAVFVKYEFWGNYLEQLHSRGIPTYIISSIFRPGQRFFRRGGGMFRRMLNCFTRLYVQDEGSRKLLADAGLTNVTVAGDTRFDRVTDVMAKTVSLPVVEKFCAGADMVMVAGSSWQPDEDVYSHFVAEHPGLRVIIAPHEFDDARLSRLRARFGSQAALYSEVNASGLLPAGCRVLIIDCFGLLSSLYRYGDLAYVGGGFGAGIHNINEAAVYGIPVIFGPEHHKFKEAADLIGLGGAFEVTDRASFENLAARMLTDARFRTDAGHKAGAYIKSHLGATDLIYSDLFPEK